MADTSTSTSDQSYSQDSRDKQSQVPVSDGLKSQNGDSPVFPVMYPVLVPGLLPSHQHQEQINRGPGLYAVPVHPYMQPFAGFPSNNTLIPFTYNLPTERSSPEAREASGEQGQQGEQPQQQQQAGPQRQVVVRRFQIAIQLDILLILKLAAVIFLFNQDGSRQRLTLLVFFASLVYLYQTGALAPVIQWLSQGMRRAAAPPARPAARPDNIPAAGEAGNENAGLAGTWACRACQKGMTLIYEVHREKGESGGSVLRDFKIIYVASVFAFPRSESFSMRFFIRDSAGQLARI